MREKIAIYIESYLPMKDKGIVEYTIDFSSINDAEIFFSHSFAEVEYSPYKFYKLVTPYLGQKRMYVGSWYKLPFSFFEGASYMQYSEFDEGSAVFSGAISVCDNEDDFKKFLMDPPKSDESVTHSIKLSFSRKVKKLVVVNCGQANWNEIYTPKETLLYDIGASSYFNQHQIKALVDKRFSLYNSKIDIIISHWDKDHFQAIKYLNSAQMKKINAVYGPSNRPQTNVYTDAINNLENNGVKCLFIAPTNKRRGRSIDLNMLSSTNEMDVYRAVKGSSRNQSGIVLCIKGSQNIALLTGDHHYTKILNAINGKYVSKKLILVAPHHGGEAGKLSVQDWQKEFSLISCAISVGHNSYNHPQQNLAKLNTLHNGCCERTDLGGDVSYTL